MSERFSDFDDLDEMDEKDLGQELSAIKNGVELYDENEVAQIDPDQPAWVYHPKKGAKLIKGEHVLAHYKCGWFDTPAAFVGDKYPKGGIDMSRVKEVKAYDPLKDQKKQEAVADSDEDQDKKTATWVNKATKDKLNDYAARKLPWLVIKTRTPVPAIKKMVLNAIKEGPPKDYKPEKEPEF
jgi:hypothetical protein